MYRLCLLLLPCTVYALEVKPWLLNEWEFQFSPSYTYSRYATIQNGHLAHPSNDQEFDLELQFCPPDNWSTELEFEFVNTPRQSWGVRSGAIQVRKLWLNDIAGDAVSFATGVDFRVVTSHALHDVSSPYAAKLNLEIHGSVGKEWSKETVWVFRTFGFLAVGSGSHGAPWLRGLISLEGNLDNLHRFQFITSGNVGLGERERVRLHHFHGYGSLKYRAIDMSFGYAYHLGEWGQIGLEYTRRIYARSFPQNVNFFTVRYQLPFSAF